jgi:mycothiol system anti-sigma-R factor
LPDSLHELYRYLDGELTDDRREVIQHHLDQCQPCARPYDFEAELRMVIAKCQEQVPGALMAKVKAALVNDAAKTPEQRPNA